MRNRKSNGIKNFKDYLVPIITFLIIFVLIYNAFSGSEEKDQNNNGKNIQLDKTLEKIKVTFGSTDTTAVILNAKNKKTKILAGADFSQGDTLRVSKGNISFKDGEGNKYKLDKNGELTNKGDSFSLKSSSLWVEAKDNNLVQMRFAKVIIPKNAIVNLFQNEVSSNIYSVKGQLEVINLAGESIKLPSGKQIVITSKNASKKDLDMDSLIKDFDEFVKISTWYLNNKKDDSLTVALNSGKTEDTTFPKSDTKTGSGKTEEVKKVSGNLLNFDSIRDEGSVTESITKISGTFVDKSIVKITISGEEARINPENKTFVVSGVKTGKKENDVVIKVFDEGGNIIAKYIYTLYYSGGKEETSDENNFSKINSIPYTVNNSDFIIGMPKVKNGSTYSNEVTFHGTVKNPNVASVYINGYKLKTFNGRTFRYHAYKRFKTLGEGVNNYEVKYIGKNGKVLLKKYVTITKKNKKTTTKIMSREATIR